VLVIDDVQWADPASLHLLDFLAGAIATTHLLVVATQRLGDEESGALREVLPALARSDAVTSIELRGLDDAAVVDLVREAAGADPDPAVVSAIVDRAGGNPFFVTELLRLEPGKLRAEAVPSAVRDVVRQRVQRLDAETARLLAVAAVVGRDIDPEVLVALEGDAALDALDAGVAMHLLEEDAPHERYRFRHALVQEVVAEPLHGLRRARLHARLARVLDARPATGPAALDRTARAELARHACAGIPVDDSLAPRAAELCLDAAAEAARELGYETSGLICERGLEAIEGTAVEPALRAALLVKLADARRAAGDPAASREACLAAAELARQAGDVDLLASAAIGLALPGAVIGMDFGVLDEVRIELLQAALDLLPDGDTALRVRLLAHLALALYLSDDRARREAAALDAVAVADRMGDPGLRAAALAARRSTLWGPASVDERIEVARRLTELAEAGGAMQTALEGHIALAIDLLEAGRLDEFATELATVDERVGQLRQPFYAWYSRILEATRASLEGRRDDAVAAATAAMEVGGVALGRRAQWGHIGWRYVHLWDHGGLEEVEPALRALSSAFPDNANVAAALAHLLVETGRPDEAATIAGVLLADPGAGVPEDATWLFTLTLLAEAAAGIGDEAGAGRLADLLVPASGRLVVAGSAVACCGSADRGRGVALLTAGRLDEAADAFQRAIDQNTAIGARPWVVRSLAGLAAVRLRQESPDDARQLLAQARAAADDLGAPGVLAAVDRVALVP
jgi:tetratricopeptide (TPR) repeat protein